MKTAVAMIGALMMLTAGRAHAADKDMAKRQAACADVANLHSSIDRLNQLGPDATLAQVKESEKRVRQNYERVTKSSGKVAGRETDNLKSSLDNLKDTISNMPDTATIRQSQNAVSGAMAQVRSADHQLANALGCEELPSTTP